MVKLSDYVADFLARQGLRHAFIISGGASIHILHSLAAHPDIEAICPHHEQAGAMAADAYARVTGQLGCAIGTSGPGATNLVTGIAGAWFDSIPVLYITGQVATYRMRGETGVRQMGFQETDILSMVAPITKHAVLVTDPNRIAYELERAVWIARSGRPGPVVVDIPDDLQRSFVDPLKLEHFVAPTEPEPAPTSSPTHHLDRLMALISSARRPVVVLGWGVRSAGAADLALQVVEQLGAPVLTSWAVKDLINEDHPLLAGTFGTHGVRAGNFAIQNADLVISIGARLSTHETGTPMSSWAREAKVAAVDIDATELGKFASFGKPLDLAITCDAGVFLAEFQGRLKPQSVPDFTDWRAQIQDWRQRYPVERLGPDAGTVDPYGFMRALAAAVPDDEHVFVDTGCSVAWMMQALPVSRGVRLFHDYNNTAMGWALPAAIGGAFALGRAVTCVSGDGSLMMNLQELATIVRHRLPVKLFVMNNQGYAMVQQTQEQWLGGDYVGTSIAGGLGFPDFVALAAAFGLPSLSLEAKADTASIVDQAYAMDGPVLVDVRVPDTERVTPQCKFGYPIEDAEPLLPRDEFLANMIVNPLPKSLEPL
jgi:acetolactate synthase-1/2/3 large subunit